MLRGRQGPPEEDVERVRNGVAAESRRIRDGEACKAREGTSEKSNKTKHSSKEGTWEKK